MRTTPDPVPVGAWLYEAVKFKFDLVWYAPAFIDLFGFTERVPALFKRLLFTKRISEKVFLLGFRARWSGPLFIAIHGEKNLNQTSCSDSPLFLCSFESGERCLKKLKLSDSVLI
ncbi:hypothetical protein P4S72_04790 [Vibrio sp. PP-XX7]